MSFPALKIGDLVARTPHLPVPGETVKGSSFHQSAGGKGFNQGIAAQLLQRMIDEARARECLGVVLTCKDHLKHYYEKFGFICRGVSNSTHGGAKWNDMLLNF